jgi:hypothetical protein
MGIAARSPGDRIPYLLWLSRGIDLLEIVDESAANGWKVVVFSYFRDTLTTIGQLIGEKRSDR